MNIFEKIMKDLNDLLLDVDAWSIPGIIFAILFIILTVGLASALSSKAEQAGSCPKLNFILGLLIPVVYPVLALLFMFKAESKVKKLRSRNSVKKKLKTFLTPKKLKMCLIKITSLN